jgi:hypothetical protein
MIRKLKSGEYRLIHVRRTRRLETPQPWYIQNIRAAKNMKKFSISKVLINS